MDWKTLLAYITGTVDQELLARHEYLVTENRLLRTQLKGRVRLSDGERKTLAAIGHKLGKQALQETDKNFKRTFATTAWTTQSEGTVARWCVPRVSPVS